MFVLLLVNMTIEINGQKPDLYCNQKYGRFNKEVCVKRYTLVTGDSFEVGDAYSLHPTAKDANHFLTDECWRETSRPFRVFVTKKTLDELMKDSKKAIFRCWEN